MSDKRRILTREEARLERAAALREYIELLAEIERDGGGVSPVTISSAAPRETSSGGDQNLCYARLPLSKVIPQYLATCRKPQTPRQIATVFKAAGREFEGDPVRAVREALRNLLATNEDVFHIRWGSWYLKSKCSKARLEKLMQITATNGTGGHGPREHAKRTSAGIAARLKEGGKWGRVRSLTPEQVEEAKIDVRNGASIRSLATKYGVSETSLRNYGVYRRKRKGESEPPREEEQPQLRLVK